MFKKLLDKALPISMGLTAIYLAVALFLYFFSDFFEFPVYVPTFRQAITYAWFHFAATLLAFLLNALAYFFQSSSHERKIQGASVVMYAVAIFSTNMFYVWGVIALGFQLILLTVTLDDKTAKLVESKDKTPPSRSSLLIVSLILTTFYFLSLLIIIGTYPNHATNAGYGFLIAFSLLHYLVAFVAYLLHIGLCVTLTPWKHQLKLVRLVKMLYLVSMFVTVPALYIITIPAMLLQIMLISVYLVRYKEVERDNAKLLI